MKNCKLIATLPNLSKKNKVEEVLSNPYVDEARYNSGVNDLMNPHEVIEELKKLSEMYKKIIWIDIKGRQLRIKKWADPRYDVIELNHDIDFDYPASVYFRNGSNSSIVRKLRNKIIVDPLPREALGAGQSVNILANNLDIKGYLTEKDKELLSECRNYDMNYIMASFVEKIDDLIEIIRLNPKANIASKIESLKGIQFMLQNPNCHLVAARDDLFIETGSNSQMLKYLKQIIERDKNAICASRIFSSLEKRKTPDLSDYSDLELMYLYGYRNFMLDDNVCNYAFDEAINAWKGLRL